MRNVKILKGMHYSLKFPRVFIAKDSFCLSYYVQFTDSCEYVIPEKSCVNKLFGFTDCWAHVHKNSIRFGWTYNNESDKIDIWSYVYINGKLEKHKIAIVNIGDSNNFSISYNGEEVEFWINGRTYATVSTHVKPKCLFYEFTPYFGGNTRAPHTMTIKMKQL